MKLYNMIVLILIALIITTSVFAQQGDVDLLAEKRRKEQWRKLQEYRRSNRNPETEFERKLKGNRQQLVDRYRRLRNSGHITAIGAEQFRKAIELDPADLSKYRSFLGQKNTGIFRLFEDNDCEGKKIIRVGDKCSSYLPFTSTYSFRQGFHVSEPIHDLKFYKNRLRSRGVLTSSIFVALKDNPISRVSLDDPEMKFLVDFSAAKNAVNVRKQAIEIANGIKANGFSYSNSSAIKVGNTYAIRVIAYRLKNIDAIINTDWDTVTPQEVDIFSELRGISDRHLKPNRRMDIIIAFKVIRKSDDGGLTIIWKRLYKKKSPKLTI